MSKNYIYSTLSCDNIYTNFAPSDNGIPIAVEQVKIKGGTGVINNRLETPQGVVTEVSDDELDALEKNHVFQIHKKNGFITVGKRLADPETVAADMQAVDEGAQLTESDFANDEAKPVVASTKKAGDSTKKAG